MMLYLSVTEAVRCEKGFCTVAVALEVVLTEMPVSTYCNTRLIETVKIIVGVTPLPPLDNICVKVIVWRLRGNIIRTAVCWIV